MVEQNPIPLKETPETQGDPEPNAAGQDLCEMTTITIEEVAIDGICGVY